MTQHEIVVICANCQRIKDSAGRWPDRYLPAGYAGRVSHGLCPACARELYPGIAEKVLAKADLNKSADN